MKTIMCMAAFWSALVVCPLAPAVAAGPPSLDVGRSCDAAARGAVSIGRDKAACMGDERAAQELLGKNWLQFPAGNRDQCVGTTTHGGSPSYVELVSCLEIMRDAASIEKDDLPSSASEKRPRSGRRSR
jgi:hypothetical protein